MIDAHALPRGRAPIEQGPALRQEVCVRVLGVQTRLDGAAAEPHLVLLKRQLLAGGNAQLPRDQIKPGDRLGHRVFDLKPGVHLDKVEFFRRTEQELDRAGAHIADGTRRRDCRLAHPGPEFSRDRGRRRLLDDLLMPALYRTVAFAEMDDVAVLVGKNLKLDMAGVSDSPLEDQFVRPEGAGRLRTRARPPRWRNRRLRWQAASRDRRRRPKP